MSKTRKKVFVLGGYGFIGSACMTALRSAGFDVTGVGRSARAARACDSTANWLITDIATADVDKWQTALADADIVVNAAGALQDGARDDLRAIHETAVIRIIAALDGRKTKIVQISAAGAGPEASTDFMRSKARGDAALMQSALDWVVLRPVLVLGPQAYGGTALLRANAALPGIGLLVSPQSPVQTVHVDDVAAAVVQAASGAIAPRTLADLTEDDRQSLGALTARIRRWQGFAPWRRTIILPGWLTTLVGAGADALGWLGWQSPFRSTALRAIADGVTGDPTPWREAGGLPMRSLTDTLAAIPGTAQERSHARLFLLLPLAIAVLSGFWIITGLIALATHTAAQALLTDRGVSTDLAALAVIGGALLDIALGAAVLVRRWTRSACAGMIALSLAYLLAGTFSAPDLWVDPLGPLVKIFPSMTLALFPLLLLEPR